MKSQVFEAARTAAAQRAVSSVAVMDSLTAAGAASGASPSIRRVDARTFVLRDGVWTDERYQSSMHSTRIKPFSKAYFDLLRVLPELRSVFALGDRVIVAGRTQAIVLSTAGVDTLTDSALTALARTW